MRTGSGCGRSPMEDLEIDGKSQRPLIERAIETERDLLSKVALRPIDWSKERVGDYMTPEPETLRLDDHVAWALKLMHVGGYRHVPLTDAEGRPVGVVSIRDIVEFIIDLFPAPVLNLPPEPRRGTASSDEAGGGTD